jgi:hypothetical protein
MVESYNENLNNTIWGDKKQQLIEQKIHGHTFTVFTHHTSASSHIVFPVYLFLVKLQTLFEKKSPKGSGSINSKKTEISIIWIWNDNRFRFG